MLLSVIKYFRGYVHVKLTGYAPERFLNLCGNRNILIWNLKPCENGYTFCISVDAFRQLKPILKKTKTQIRIQKRVGMPFCAFRYRRRYLFPAGLLFFCFFLRFSSACCQTSYYHRHCKYTSQCLYYSFFHFSSSFVMMSCRHDQFLFL